MTTESASSLRAFQWARQPGAEALLRGIVNDFLARCPAAKVLAERMRVETGTRFFDWIDSIELPAETANVERFLKAGFVEEREGRLRVLRNPGGIFPRVAVGGIFRVLLKVDSVADFLAVNQIDCAVSGRPFSPLREAVIARGGECHLAVVERRGSGRFAGVDADPVLCVRAAKHFEQFRRRRRDFLTEAEGFAYTHKLAEAAIGEIGVDATCAWFFAAEREYWERKNRAARVQKARQDRLGLGWGNHDHHTYRSSREFFKLMIGFFERLGCVCRERFYAGKEAGWGAQVMENERAGIVVFADVDLAPEELVADFAHEPLAPRDRLGTVGLWCGLHGEAFFQAGMHHLECQFDFEALKAQLEGEYGIKVMKPFTDFGFLRQAFTEGERWPVAEERLAKLLRGGLITAEQADMFRKNGAVGSHLENLERNEGYKGFNQKGVSEIIAATDPRRL